MRKAIVWHFGCLGRTEENVARLADKIRENGDSAEVLVAHISDWKKVSEAAETFTGDDKRIEALFAKAEVNGTWASVREFSVEDLGKHNTYQPNGYVLYDQGCCALFGAGRRGIDRYHILG